MAACNDNAMPHKLTVQFSDDGTFQYLGNEISEGGTGESTGISVPGLEKQWEEADGE